MMTVFYKKWEYIIAQRESSMIANIKIIKIQNQVPIQFLICFPLFPSRFQFNESIEFFHVFHVAPVEIPCVRAHSFRYFPKIEPHARTP